jgi:hypothetical protein
LLGVNYRVEAISKGVATKLVVEKHYLHRAPPITAAFGLLGVTGLVGVCTFGTPGSRHVQLSACKTRPERVIELNRALNMSFRASTRGTHFGTECDSLRNECVGGQRFAIGQSPEINQIGEDLRAFALGRF